MWSETNAADEITKGLWLGNIRAANDPSFFDRHNMSVVINCTDDIPFPSFYATKRIRAVRFPLSSIYLTNNDDLLFNNIDEVENVLNSELRNERNVLVHCFEGRQRSATLVAYHIMKRTNSYDCDRTIQFMRERCPIALQPQPVFHAFFSSICRTFTK